MRESEAKRKLTKPEAKEDAADTERVA